MKAKTVFLIIVVTPLISLAQPQDPAYQHTVPDKAFELSIPVLLILAFLHTVVSIFRIKAENKVRQQLIDKGISDDALKQMLLNGNERIRMGSLKWGLIIGCAGLGLFVCQFLTFGFITFSVLFISIAAGMIAFYILSGKYR